MLSVSGLCPGLQASNNPGLFKIVSGCFGLPLGNEINFPDDVVCLCRSPSITHLTQVS